MTQPAQDLNVVWIRPFGQMSCVRVFVMALQIFFASAFFTTITLCNYLSNCFARIVGSFAAASFPVWMAATFWHRNSASAFCGAILSSSSVAFAYLKLFSAALAGAIKKCLRSFGLRFVCAFSGARTCGSSYMSIRSCKLFTANAANQRCATSAFNSSLEFCHG